MSRLGLLLGVPVGKVQGARSLGRVGARGWTRSACGAGAGLGCGGLIRCRRYQGACGTPTAAQAARVPTLGAMTAIASSVTNWTRARCPRSWRSSPRALAVFDWTSTTKRALASSCSSWAFSFCSRAICASCGSAAGRPRGRAGPVSAPRSRDRRQSTMWLEYRPSRRKIAPFSPGPAGHRRPGPPACAAR